uniref:Uncharacterized protein n=1 Tax=viral metagenome TaxID=1070528 RepID=A0A6C0F3L4_9ZZZZ
MFTSHFFAKNLKSKITFRKWTKINVQNPFGEISFGISKNLAFT